jgi:predicted nucleotidyltransferase
MFGYKEIPKENVLADFLTEEQLRYNKIMIRLHEHYLESLQYFPEDQIVGCFLQGSQNYGLDHEESDVDTKLIVVPSFKDICLNRKPVSTTHVRANDEHTDWKDVRLYMETFRKQNLNFLEILFTDFYIINPIYQEQWMRLVEHREEIARMNPYRAVKSMKGIGLEKYHAMEHRYPSKADIIDKYGYDGKQTSHQIRVWDYLRRYIAGEKYEDCLRPTPSLVPRIMDYKALSKIPLWAARYDAEKYKSLTEALADDYCAAHEEYEDPAMRDLLEDVSYNIMKIAVERELQR